MGFTMRPYRNLECFHLVRVSTSEEHDAHQDGSCTPMVSTRYSPAGKAGVTSTPTGQVGSHLFINPNHWNRLDDDVDDYLLAFRIGDPKAKVPGCYHGEVGEGMNWSSTHYNTWRAELCRRVLGVEVDAIWDLCHDEEGKERLDVALTAPFVELIDFSDCEGTLGAMTVRKLADDFATWKRLLSKIEGRRPQSMMFDDNFHQLFDKVRAVFAWAAEGGGVVQFQ